MGLVTTFAFSLEMSGAESTARSRLRIPGQLLQTLPRLLVQRLATRVRLGTRPLRTFESFMALEPTNVVFTSREFQPRSDLFVERCHFVGPTALSRDPVVDFPFDRLDGSRPAVYISLGTILREPELLKHILRTFSSFPAQFVLSLGGGGGVESLGAIPDNFLVRDYVPQTALLAHVDAFITHGGLNSVHESLLAGVPMVPVPLQVEEATVARRVQECGAGIAPRLDPPYGDVGERELGTGLRAAGGADRAARVILEAAGRTDADGRR